MLGYKMTSDKNFYHFRVLHFAGELRQGTGGKFKGTSGFLRLASVSAETLRKKKNVYSIFAIK